LRTQPQRPGELAELIDVVIDAAVADRVRCNAAAAGLPVELALYIAVEAERALAEAVDVVGIDGGELIAFLDGVAVDTDGRGPRHVLVRSLAEYGAALTRGEGQPASSGSVCVRVPHRVAASWAHAAATAGLSFDRWLTDLVARAEFARVSWEAAAARSGRSLSEWVLLQAARCARSRNTSPQTTASG
jgi:predicted HicB family RNase H-like nuclease